MSKHLGHYDSAESRTFPGAYRREIHNHVLLVPGTASGKTVYSHLNKGHMFLRSLFRHSVEIYHQVGLAAMLSFNQQVNQRGPHCAVFLQLTQYRYATQTVDTRPTATSYVFS